MEEDRVREEIVRLMMSNAGYNDDFYFDNRGNLLPEDVERFEGFIEEANQILSIKGLLIKSLPKIICLCGSTRFTNEMLVKQWELTKQGFIVLSWCALPDSYFQGEDNAHIGDQEGVKEIIDEVHKRKIDLCDEVFVLNIEGYIGESTRSEIDYATQKEKTIKYLEG